MLILISGIIGTGKTVIGKRLASCLNYYFDDLDGAIEREKGKSIGQVVADEGWLSYRHLEYQLCKQYAAMQDTVIALAGGTPRYEWNRDVLHNTGIKILLLADLKECFKRVYSTRDRPRVNPGTSMEQDITRIWENHKQIYLDFGQIHYRTDQGKTVNQEVNELLKIINKETYKNG